MDFYGIEKTNSDIDFQIGTESFSTIDNENEIVDDDGMEKSFETYFSPFGNSKFISIL